MTADRRPRRGAYSLIEMVLVIGGITIILGLCAGLLHALLRLDRAGRNSVSDAMTLSRLARQFRQDVRAAREGKPGGENGQPPRLELRRPDGPSVVYRVEGGRLLREETRKGEARRRESYAVERLAPVALELDGEYLRLVLSRSPSSTSSPALSRPAVHVEARLGKDEDASEPSEARK